MHKPDTYEDENFIYTMVPPTFFDRLLMRFGFTPPDRGYTQKSKGGWCGTPYVSEIEKIEEHQFVLGKNISGDDVTLDLTLTPHVIIAGSTGSGKSNILHHMIVKMLSVRYHSMWQFVLIDPKCVEYDYHYKNLSVLFTPIVEHNVEEAVEALNKIVKEIDRRNEALNANPGESFKDIFVAIDEFSDLMAQAPKETEAAILHIAEHGQRSGVYLAIATSRPSDDVLTKRIRDAIPARIVGAVSSSLDSKRLLGVSGAEKLLGKGDMLFNTPDLEAPIRFQARLIPQELIHDIAHNFR